MNFLEKFFNSLQRKLRKNIKINNYLYRIYIYKEEKLKQNKSLKRLKYYCRIAITI